jgi:hypothetical protein
MVSEYGSLPFPICHQLLSGQLDQCARLSFPCSLYWIQSLQLIFLSTKLNTCVCVCLVAMNSIILLWVISVYWKSCSIKGVRYLTRTCRLFADEHSLSFFWISKKNVKCRCLDGKKNLSVFWEKKIYVSEERFSKCEEGEKWLSVEFRVFGKKRNWKKSSGKKNQSGFFGGFKVKDFAKFVFTGWVLC